MEHETKAPVTKRTMEVMLDITAVPIRAGGHDAYFSAIETRLLQNDTHRVRIIMTPEQHDKLPRRFDAYGERLRIERLATCDARDFISKHLTNRTLIIASTPWPFERWAALDPDVALTIEPADAIARFERDGTLGAPAVVTRPLSRIADRDGRARAPHLPSDRRRLAYTLAAGTPISSGYRNETMDVRHAWADEMGVEASATPEEWAACFAKRIAPVRFARGSAKTLTEARVHARLTRGYSSVIEVQGTRHVFNPNDMLRAELAGDSDLVEHSVAPDGAAVLEAMLADAAALTFDDVSEDPSFHALVERHLTCADDAPILESARLALLERRDAWRSSRRPSATTSHALSLLAESCRGVVALHGVRVDRFRSRRTESWIVPGRPEPMSETPPPAAGVGIARSVRETSTVGIVLGDHTKSWPTLGADRANWAAEVIAWWLPMENAEAALGRSPAEAQVALGPTLDDAFWGEADRHWAFLRVALMRVLARPSVIMLPSGAFLLDLGHGVFAEIDARTHEPDDSGEIHVALDATFTRESTTEDWRIVRLQRDDDSISRVVAVHEALTVGYGVARTVIGGRLPRGVWVRGRGARVHLVFRGSALFADASRPMDVAGCVAGAQALDASNRDSDIAASDDDDD